MICAILPVFRKLRKIAQNLLHFMRKRYAKVSKYLRENYANCAKKYGNFVETLYSKDQNTVE